MRFVALASVLFATAVSIFATPIVQRDTTQSAAAILTDLSDKVTPLALKLHYATTDNATEANLRPIIDEMSTSITDAVSNLKLLSGSPTVGLASRDGMDLLGPSDIANLLGGIVQVVFQAIEAVLQVVDSGIYDIIRDLLVTLGQIVFTLISVLLPLVAGLLVPLLSLLAPILSIVSSLGLTSLLSGILGGILGGIL